LGALLLIASVVPILLTLSVYGPENGWTNARTITYLVAGIVFGILFIMHREASRRTNTPTTSVPESHL
jgi:hypothetical protein